MIGYNWAQQDEFCGVLWLLFKLIYKQKRSQISPQELSWPRNQEKLWEFCNMTWFHHRVSRSPQSRRCPRGTCLRVRGTPLLCPGPGSELSEWTGRWSSTRNNVTSSCTTHTPGPSPEATTSSRCPCLPRRKRKSPHLQFLRNQRENQLSCQIRERLPQTKRRKQKGGSGRASRAQELMWVGEVMSMGALYCPAADSRLAGQVVSPRSLPGVAQASLQQLNESL